MGIFSSKKQTTNITEKHTDIRNDNRDVSAKSDNIGGVGFAVGSGSNANVTVNDENVLKEAIKGNNSLYETTIKGNNSLLGGLFKFLGEKNTTDAELQAKTTNDALIVAQDNNELKQLGLETTQGKKQDTIDTAVKIAGIISLIFVFKYFR